MSIRNTITPLAPPDLEQMEQYYQLPRRGEVIDWLEQHPVLVPILLEARNKLRDYFADAAVSLEVVVDPEMIGYAQLVAFIIPKVARMRRLISWSNSITIGGWTMESWRRISLNSSSPTDEL